MKLSSRLIFSAQGAQGAQVDKKALIATFNSVAVAEVF